MLFSFFNRFSRGKIIVTDSPSRPAQRMLKALLSEFPELLMACVVEVSSGNILSSYVTQARYQPGHVSLRYAQLVRRHQEVVAAGSYVGGALTEMSLVLEDQLHHLRLLNAGQWYCFLAVRLADANLALTREVVRRCTGLAIS